MTTLEIEIAVMAHVGVRQNVIVNGIPWGLNVGNQIMHECDLLVLSKSNYATEVEIKVSKADLLKDKEKTHKHMHNHIKYLWFAVPEKLKEIALQEIPERAGLYIIQQWEHGNTIHVEKQPQANKMAVKWTEAERNDLMRLGAMRILTLKRQVLRANQANNQMKQTIN